jgi:plastocyanin
LKDGVYNFFCDPHASTLRGSFKVGNPPSSPSPAAKPAAAKLLATVGPSATITLTRGGKKVTALKAGAYTIAVRDRSSFHNFRLIGPGLNRATTVSFTGTKTWKVTLRKGVYRFRCDPHRSDMKGSFRVS